MFIEVVELKYKDKYVINTNNISFICEASQTILLNGTHGNGCGLITVRKEDIEKILNNITIIQ